MEHWRGKVALVTGASSGIGYDTAKKLAELGMNVVGCARNTAKIEALSSELKAVSGSGDLLSVKCDVRHEEEIVAVFEAARAQFGGVDVLVNSAGLSHKAPLLTGTTEDWRDILEVNVLGLCVCTREFMTQLKSRGVDRGHVIHLGSVVGHVFPTSSAVHMYAVSKHAVKALTEGARRELREMKSNVKITCISPGVVRTEFRGRFAYRGDAEKLADEKLMSARYDNDPGVPVPLEAEDVTSAIVYALSAPPHVQIHDLVVRPTSQIW